MGRILKVNGSKVRGWAQEIEDELNTMRLDMARFMAQGHLDPLEYHEFMWLMLKRLETASVAAANIKEAKYEE